ncbi:hypothetical protein L248_0533 [Schleiferilactobacillus shenzhenensis LY-73]|uniref:Uncharacterized protein n=1 Tax=Schleiferilactobacillus shenzhenensis LY-73 TaxID=1231336 RepID=U4TL62_9LACO|nr:hypothetical protein L248_0533 [Schleiferilactobacillus shenzhenensis LY-73]
MKNRDGKTILERKNLFSKFRSYFSFKILPVFPNFIEFQQIFTVFR